MDVQFLTPCCKMKANTPAVVDYSGVSLRSKVSFPVEVISSLASKSRLHEIWPTVLLCWIGYTDVYSEQ